jgi:tetratricopeptide (TPR) repeat protein
MGRVLSIEWEMGNIASVYREQGELDKALKIYEEILTKKEKKRDYNRVGTLNYIGEIYRLKGEIQKAFEFHRESLRLCEEGKRLGTKPLTLNFLGIDYIVLGDYEKAFVAFGESFRLQEDFYRKAEPLTNIAEVYYRQGKLAEAMAKCEESLAFSRTYGGRIQTGVTLHRLGKNSNG